ncbi:bifunctional NAD(P)/FAD-dependent oxidoreductase/class I SAM-dependent methyltransferase [Nocardioides sp. zg-1228]|uniref:bifunctional NAD(P)/FAD-dependent oxidoreductase/class I SAM-dependent methyltransferase n=1 Tax=Nocardioides sp. zg-1228 TaxID=2763008 RepID=UPI001642631F|nr:bifunctional NAD(P)/FAD-dependent oxidoreductase/class I SAM-dependent methyltransferase [Nocardioides sp. zg-1228]MBC2931485.1 NAD(P)/FAD-dependent oxidoreductase [Nocardioides sp. zg-1228]QSF57091.1 NAD(P)/FAD-dependent oxidoreductase [Nocardioides sp. zg-1228]
MSENERYDVVVVGGGVAGLSGAMALGRSRRSVLVVDAGEPRNAPAGHAHNYLGREGVAPLELLGDGRAEVAAYGVEVLADRVVGVSGEADAFLVTTEGGRRYGARRVLVTGGMVDELPDVPGLAQRWGRDVLHCPYCHGWEVRDRPLAILATSPMAGHQGLLFGQLSADVVMIVHDGVELADDELERLGAIGVRVEHGTPREVVTDGERLVGLRLADGSVLEREAIVVASRPHVRADHLAPLGIEPQPVEMGGAVLGSVIGVEPNGATTVPGVFAAGNATDISMTLMASAAHGTRVGAWINGDLAAADAARAVEARRAGMFERPAWEDRYAGERVWSGRVNAQLEAEVASLAPARALDVGCGEGGDAVWLARQGWDVTAIDFADAALARTSEHAAQAGVGERVATRRVDVRTFDAAGETWDLVSSQFMHLPDGAMPELVRRLAAAVAPGGTLLVVGHHPGDRATGMRHGHHSFLFTPESLLPGLPDGFVVETCETRSRTQAHPGSGEQIAVSDSVLRARRVG